MASLFFVFLFRFWVITRLKIVFFHRNFKIPESVIFLKSRKYETEAFYTYPYEPCSWKNFFALVSLEVVKQMHFRRAVFLHTLFIVVTLLPFFFYYWSNHNEILWTQVRSENKRGDCYVLFLIFYIENELFTEKRTTVPPVPPTSSHSLTNQPSFIHTTALIFHRHARNIFMLHFERKNFILKFCHFSEYGPVKWPEPAILTPPRHDFQTKT